MSRERLGDYIERVMGQVKASDLARTGCGRSCSLIWRGGSGGSGRLGDDGAAAERTIQRLGESGDLTRSLQIRSPGWNGALCTPCIPGILRRLEALAAERRRDGPPLRGPDHGLDDGAGRRWQSPRVPGGRRGAGPSHRLVDDARLVCRLPDNRRRGHLCWDLPLRRDDSRPPVRVARRMRDCYAASSSLMVMALLAGFVLMVSLGTAPWPGLSTIRLALVTPLVVLGTADHLDPVRATAALAAAPPGPLGAS